MLLLLEGNGGLGWQVFFDVIFWLEIPMNFRTGIYRHGTLVLQWRNRSAGHDLT